jgi:DDE family transposase
MDYSTLTQPPVGIEEAAICAQTPKNSLYKALQMLPDKRRGAGKRYPLPVLICLLCLAKMAGQTTLKGATEWVRLRAAQLSSAFGLKRTAMPCQMTYKRILETIDAQVLNDVLAAFFTRWEAESRCENEPSRLQTVSGHLEHTQVAIDGKAVRATSKEDQPVHQLSAYDVKTGVVLFQVNVQEKQNEISALKPLLTPSFIKGRIFSLDAMHTQTELCAKIDHGGGYYLLVAKDNQPSWQGIWPIFSPHLPAIGKGLKLKPGTKHMVVSNTATSFAAPISMLGLPSGGEASGRSFGSNELRRYSKRAKCASKQCMGSAIFLCRKLLLCAC